MVDVIGELIAAAPYLSSTLPRENIAKSLRSAVDIVTEGNVAAFARLIGMPKNTTWMWHTGKVLPNRKIGSITLPQPTGSISLPKRQSYGLSHNDK
ncbi:MAG: hypothetical protein KME25_32810 [Symplocastrum torsivum CPER-KK1]|uniref:Uncharacterized protein n=1 Tax=Symplocastrum torsivum CPER-KK1 TaxID=450513 RepID=A0A951UDC3_9CYAN|nr:hypothetical protein [Symplocastrum torsivum CPER-KK1]